MHKSSSTYHRHDYRTRVQWKAASGVRLDHTQGVLMLGSCFTTEIGARLTRDMFDVSANPFGVLYNPMSVADALDRILKNRCYTDADLVCDHQGVWHSWSLHSSFSSVNRERVLLAANESLARARAVLEREGDTVWVFITFGTSRCYKLVDEGTIVANCHKYPQAAFVEIDLGIEDIVNRWRPLLSELREVVPDVQVVFTVSPVRYLAYGPAGNSLSKALLRVAVEQLVAENDNAQYFPAYEALADDLRDYRFYAGDMVHPSDEAANYIYSLLTDGLCDEATRGLADECRRLRSRVSHRPLVDNPDAIDAFAMQTRLSAEDLARRYPFLGSRIIQLLNQSL